MLRARCASESPRARVRWLVQVNMATPASVQRVYLSLLLGNTLAASLIWGINTIFLLDAGLSNLEAFAANAFFTAGMVIFEVPTGIVADTIGRRVSYLLGTVTLARLDAALRDALAARGAVLGVGDRLDAARSRVHVLLGGGRGVARRRAHGDGLRGQPRVGLRQGPDRHGCGNAVRLRCRRLHRPGDEPRRAVRPARDRPRADVRARIRRHEGHRLHPDSARGARPGRAADLERVDRVRLEGAGGEVDDAGVAVHGRGRHLRVLRPAAVPARAYGDPEAYGIAGLVAAIVAGAQIVGGIAAPWIRRRFDAAHVGVAGRDGGERRDAGVDRRLRELLCRDRPDRRLGPPVRGVDADPAGVPERPDPLAAAGDDPLLRLDAGLDRRRRRPAGAGPVGGRVGLSGVVPARARRSRRSRCRSCGCRGDRTRLRTPPSEPRPHPKRSRPASPRMRRLPLRFGTEP